MTDQSDRLSVILLPLLAVACLHPAVSSATGLVLGLGFGLLFAHPYPDFNKQWVHRFLAWSIIGLGAGMNLAVLARVGLSGIAYTFTGIVLTMLLGLFLGKMLRPGADSNPNQSVQGQDDLSLLISSGTAICGGSAIAAVSSTLRSKPADVSSALIVVFLLNSIALVIFPPLGHYFGLDEQQFGLWAALAIHDTSSVVGACMHYGTRALEVGATIKLARALWIIPLTFLLGMIFRRQDVAGQQQPIKKPWFILGFLIAAALVTWIPGLQEPGQWVATAAKRLFVVTLFFIGTGFTRTSLKALSVRPLIQAVLLWSAVASASLAAILQGWIKPGF